MHYYQKNIGDYGRDTGHLSALEHGVYNLLIDWYYLNERPITMKEAIRVSRGNPDETQVVLSEFFKETKDGWIHSYADRIIAEYHAKAERNRANGAKGGRPPKSSQHVDYIETKTQAVLSGMPEQTLTTNHKPLTNNTEKQKDSVQPLAARSRFDDFWTVYPNKKGRQPAEKKWAKEKLDGMADSIIAHVLLMKSQDDGWRRGYAPMGSTYLNQARWTDVPQSAPDRNNGQNHAQPKLTPAERIAVNIALNNGGEIPSGYENNGNVVAEVGRNLRPQVDGGLRGARDGFGGSDLGEGIKWVNGDAGSGRAEGLLGEF